MVTEPQVLIVGSGPAGVSAAWPLVAAGIEVTLIDAGMERLPPTPPDRPSLSALRRDPDKTAAWRFLLGPDLSGLRVMPGVSPKLRAASDCGFLEGFSTLNRIQTKDFEAIGVLARGGLSNLWGAASSVYDDRDLGSQTLRYSDLESSYTAVAKRIGISGSAEDDMGGFHGDHVPLQPPLSLSPAASDVLERYRALRPKIGMRMGRARSAVLSQDQGERKACSLDGMCVWGCAKGAVYNSADDLDDLIQKPNFRYRDGLVAAAIEPLNEGHRLHCRDRRNGGSVTFDASFIILAAGTIGSTRLVLQTLEKFDKPVPIHNNPAFAVAFFMPWRVGSALPAESFALAQLNFRRELDSGGDYALGALYGAEGFGALDFLPGMPTTSRGALALLNAVLPAIMLGLVYLPGEYSRNTLSISRTRDDEMGCEIILQGGVSDDHSTVERALLKGIKQDFRKLGMIMIPGLFRRYGPGAEAHYGASLSMGKITSDKGEVKDLPNLYVVDGSILPRLSAKHPTFTIMANADRVGRNIVRKLGEKPDA